MAPTDNSRPLALAAATTAAHTMSRPRLLLVTATFAPSRVIGGRRAERLAGHLARAGWEVTVLTLHGPYMAPVDPALSPPDGVEILRTHAAMPRAWLRAGAERLRQFRPAVSAPSTPQVTPGRSQPSQPWLRRALDRALASLEEPDEFAGWHAFALRAVAGRTFDIVLNSVPPMSSLATAAAIADQTQARLVLDYRDPWWEISAPAEREWVRSREDQVLRRADLVVGVTPTICDMLATRASTPVALITNGFEGTPFADFAPASRMPARLVYAGSLAYGRDLEPLLQAMACLRPDIGADALRLEYAGQHGGRLRSRAADLGLGDAVVDHGERSSAQANALLSGAVAGVVVVSDGFDYAYPGKIFEILGQARPLLVIAPAGCATAQLVEKHGLGWCHPAGDVTGLAATLRGALMGQRPQPRDVASLQVDAVMGRYEVHLRALLTRTA